MTSRRAKSLCCINAEFSRAWPGVAHSGEESTLIKKPTYANASVGEVGTTGFEPAASCTPCKRATGLRYVPNGSFRGCKSMIKIPCYKMDLKGNRIFAQFLIDEGSTQTGLHY